MRMEVAGHRDRLPSRLVVCKASVFDSAVLGTLADIILFVVLYNATSQN